MQAFAFRDDPDVPKFDDTKPLIVFDSVCFFCSKSMRIVFKHDSSKNINFAAVQSQLGAALLKHYDLDPNDPASFIYFEDGRAQFSSSAVFALCGKLKGWPRLLQLFWIIPRPLTDLLYKVVAQNRYKWFGRSQTCLVPTPEMKSRLIDFPMDVDQ